MRGEMEAAATLAHEVKNPLALIRANVDVLKAGANGEESKKCIELIYREIDRINNVVTGYVFSKENSEIIFIEDLICDVIDEYHVTDNKSVEFVIEAADEELCVRASYSKLCILFFNIYKNAVEAVEEKGVIITEIEGNHELVTVKVTDNGKGLDEDIADAVGQPFVSGKEDGMGLGIAICKRIAQEYGGDVRLENAKEGGCRAVVTLAACKK